MEPTTIAGVFSLCGAAVGFGGAVAVEFVRGRSTSSRETADRVSRFQIETLTQVQERARELFLAVMVLGFTMEGRRSAEASRDRLDPLEDTRSACDEAFRALDMLDEEFAEKPDGREKPDVVEHSEEYKKLRKTVEGYVAKLEARLDAENALLVEAEKENQEARQIAGTIVELRTLVSRVLNAEIAEHAEALCECARKTMGDEPEDMVEGDGGGDDPAKTCYYALQDMTGREILLRLKA